MVEGGAFAVLVEFLHLQAQIVDGSLDLGPPLLERIRGKLDPRDAQILNRIDFQELALPLVVVLGEALLPARILILKVLGHGVEHEFEVGIHGFEAALETSEMIVGRERIQIELGRKNQDVNLIPGVRREKGNWG